MMLELIELIETEPPLTTNVDNPETKLEPEMVITPPEVGTEEGVIPFS